MERAGRLIARWKTSGDCVAPEDLARAAWRVAAGKKITAHTTGVILEKKRLVVLTEDDVWRRQLSTLRPQLLANLAKILGEGTVTRLEFQVVRPRIGPGREQELRRPAARQGAVTDEADHIEDPVLRELYKRARQRESA